MESWDFIKSLGLNLDEMNLPIIKKLIVSSPNGKCIEQDLPLGGFGISRYKLDDELYKIAKNVGVKIYEETKVDTILFDDDSFIISSSKINIQSRIVAASFGKRSNLDIKWSRNFIKQKPNKLNNYIGIKYHVQVDFPTDTIALHNFKNGYCGISKVEDEKYCLCYLTTAENLKMNNNSIGEMEKKILHQNKLLKKIFTQSKILFDEPVVISQISFDKKSQVENHVLMTGDAAGMITPLCGNGMSMALHGSKIAFECINAFLQNKISRQQMEEHYTTTWKKEFEKRLRTGRVIQSFFGGKWITNIFISALKPFPGLVKKLITATHGKAF